MPDMTAGQSNVIMKTPLAVRLYSMVWRLFKINSGLTRTSFNWFTNRYIGPVKGDVIATTVEGIRLRVRPNDYHGRVLLIHGTNDRKVSRVACAFARPGEIFLDIGANYSTIGFAVSQVVGASGRVHLFEPQPWLTAVVQEAIAAKAIRNITQHRVALFENDGEMTLRIPRHHSGMATLIDKTDDGGDWIETTVQTRNTTDYLRPLLGDRSFGVKIDVEGAEPAILAELFNFPGLKYCLFEGCSNEKWLFDNFSAKGFVIYGLERNLLACRLRRVHDFSVWHDFHDFIAFPTAASLPDRASPAQLARIARADSR